MSNCCVVILKLASSNGVPQRSCTVAVIVGTILTLINQGNLIFNGQQPVWWKLALTFVVPYCVATYGAVSSQLVAIKKAELKQQQQKESHFQVGNDKLEKSQNEFCVELNPVTSNVSSEISLNETDITKNSDLNPKLDKQYLTV